MVMMIREMELREEGLEEGLEKGREEGKILGAIEIMREDGRNNADIIARLMCKYGLSQIEAERYLTDGADSLSSAPH